MFSNVRDVLKRIDTVVHKTRTSSAAQLRSRILLEIRRARSQPYDPVLKHAVNYVAAAAYLEQHRAMHEHVLERVQRMRLLLDSLPKQAVEAARRKLPRNAAVLTRGEYVLAQKALMNHKETVLVVGAEATTHTLSRSGIKTLLFSDAAARAAIKQVDVVLLGCDVITSSSIVSSVGAELVAQLAHASGVPVYVVATGLQFDPHAERQIHQLSQYSAKPFKRSSPTTERYQGNYEAIDPALVTGIISELGVLDHGSFIHEVHHQYPWLFLA